MDIVISLHLEKLAQIFGILTGSMGSVHHHGLHGRLEFTGGCLVNAETLRPDANALAGDAEGSLAEVLDLVTGSATICWWDDVLMDLGPITSATLGDDQTLDYQTTGEFADYTVWSDSSGAPLARW